jgi:predicted dehydrogenase
MAIRIAFLSTAHMHSWGYGHGLKQHPEVVISGVWDPNPERGKKFAEAHGTLYSENMEQVLGECDAVIICSENVYHAELGIAAARAGKHVLCEKPLVTNEADGKSLIEACRQANVVLMTAFPCRYSPAFQRLVQRVQAGEIGKVQAICATNRGTCPFDWFVEKSLSGGGAMIDHVVHVTDLLRVLLGSEVMEVQAQIGNRMYEQEWEDTAMLTLQFENGIFATLDSSWSRHESFKTWGDVTMNVVGENGVLELDMFNQIMDLYSSGIKTHSLRGFGSDLDGLLVADFVECIKGKPVTVTGEDGLAAAMVAIKGYEAAAKKSVVAV